MPPSRLIDESHRRGQLSVGLLLNSQASHAKSLPPYAKALCGWPTTKKEKKKKNQQLVIACLNAASSTMASSTHMTVVLLHPPTSNCARELPASPSPGTVQALLQQRLQSYPCRQGSAHSARCHSSVAEGISTHA